MKNYFYLLLFAVLLTLQSCSVSTEATFYKDKTSTSIVELDAAQMLSMMSSFATDEDGKNPTFDDMKKLPSEFTSMYDIRKSEGNVSSNPDSVRILKKIFLKKLGSANEITGTAFKFEKFTKQDIAMADHLLNGNKQSLPIDKFLFTDWDGKKLVLNTSNFSEDLVKELLNANLDSAESSENNYSQNEQMKMMIQMLGMKANFNLKFEGKIKSITGKHDFVSKVDDKTISITLDVNKLLEDNPTWGNADKEIIIITE